MSASSAFPGFIDSTESRRILFEYPSVGGFYNSLMETFAMNFSWCNKEDYNRTYWYYTNDTCDERETIYAVPTSIIVLLSILYGIISILAVVGNSLVMWIIGTSRRMQNVTNLFIANLAFADIVIGLFAIPFQFQAALLQRWDLPEFMCPFCPFIQILTVNVSVFTLTAIAIDRHREILKPLSAKPSKLTAKIIIAAIWIVAGVLAGPTLIALRVTMEPENTNCNSKPSRYKPFCHPVNFSDDCMLLYSGLLMILQYFIPLSIISCLYARMILKLWGHRPPGNAENSRDANLMKHKMKVIKMFITVVALFAICWLPRQTYTVIQYSYEEVNQYEYIHYLWFFFDWLAMSNSCCNPFIYGMYREKFRREFQQRFPFKLRRWSANPPTDNTDTDKTQTTRASIRHEWRQTLSGSYPTVTSFCKAVVTRGSTHSFVDDHQRSARSKQGISHYIRSRHKNNYSLSSNRSEELYVFSSNKNIQDQDLEAEELCL